LVPLAVLHKSFLRIFERFYSLAAQISYLGSVNSVSSAPPQTESNVSVAIVRRELACLDSNKFACRILGVPVTFKNLFRVLFWLIFILISLKYKSDKLLESSTNPLGVYDTKIPKSRLSN
jgi:hypothetical protein